MTPVFFFRLEQPFFVPLQHFRISASNASQLAPEMAMTEMMGFLGGPGVLGRIPPIDTVDG